MEAEQRHQPGAQHIARCAVHLDVPVPTRCRTTRRKLHSRSRQPLQLAQVPPPCRHPTKRCRTSSRAPRLVHATRSAGMGSTPTCGSALIQLSRLGSTTQSKSRATPNEGGHVCGMRARVHAMRLPQCKAIPCSSGTACQHHQRCPPHAPAQCPAAAGRHDATDVTQPNCACQPPGQPTHLGSA